MTDSKVTRTRKKRTVYVVTSGEYSGYGINCVFSREKDAEAYCAKRNGTSDSYQVEPYDLDRPGDIAMARKGKTFYRVTIEGKRYGREGYPYVSAMALLPDDPIINEDKLSNLGDFATYVDAKDKETAIKVAQDRLAEHKARLAGIA